MHQGRSVFSQVMDFFPEREFQSIVERYEGNKWVQSFTCRSHFNVMAFAQLTGRESLRDIETCLSANSRHLHHMGIQSGVSRNNLAHANETRDWRIYRDIALLLIARARRLYAGEPLNVDLEGAVYAFDSTTVELCLTLFPWASFRKAKAGIKMHTAVDVRGNIPSFIHIEEHVRSPTVFERVDFREGPTNRGVFGLRAGRRTRKPLDSRGIAVKSLGHYCSKPMLV